MQKNQSTKLIFLLFVIISTVSTISGSIVKMAENPQQSSDVYIVYTEKPAGDAEPESFHLSTLSSVVGGEDAAKESLLYIYKSAATGFSAKLTPEQVSQLEQKPGVLQVVRSQTVQLHGGSVGGMI